MQILFIDFPANTQINKINPSNRKHCDVHYESDNRNLFIILYSPKPSVTLRQNLIYFIFNPFRSHPVLLCPYLTKNTKISKFHHVFFQENKILYQRSFPSYNIILGSVFPVVRCFIIFRVL